MNQDVNKPPVQENLTDQNIEGSNTEKITQERERIEKEYQRKLYVVKHKERIAKWIKITGWSLLGLLLAIAIVILALKVVDIFKQGDEVVVPIEVQEDRPPQDFVLDIEEIVLLQPKKGEINYDVLIEIKNSNKEWGVSRFTYDIILKDRFDKVVGEKKRVGYILPDQEKNLIEIGMRADQIVENAEVKIDLQEIQKLKQAGDLDIEIEESDYYIRDNKGFVEGVLFNDSPFSYDRVDIGVVVYNDLGKVIGLNYTNVGSFVTKTRRSFVAQWPDVVFENVGKIYIEPSVNVYQSGSFMNIYGTGQTLDY